MDCLRERERAAFDMNPLEKRIFHNEVLNRYFPGDSLKTLIPA